jgi:ribosomal protein S18 acetylase RimI-like enzyme
MEIITKDNGYTIKDNGEILGSSFCGDVSENLIPQKDFMGKSKTLMGFWINNDQWNKGLGTYLLRGIIKEEKKIGTEYLKLGVNKTNTYAIKLYENCGFKKDGDIGSNNYFMWLKL